MRGFRSGRALARRRQHGGEIVEFALTFPLLVLLLAGFLELGIALSDASVFADASRAAAREAIRGDAQCAAGARTAADNVLATAVNLWSGGTTYTCAACTIPNDCNTRAAGQGLTVTVSLPYQLRILPNLPDWAGGNSVTISRSTTMRMMPN
jgi:Flp pilus assembly protein TadG